MAKFARGLLTVVALAMMSIAALSRVANAQGDPGRESTAAALPVFRLASPNPSTLILMQGQAGMATLALASGSSFHGQIELRCTGATAGLQCLVSPQSIVLRPGETSEATIAVATQGASSSNLRSSAVGYRSYSSVLKSVAAGGLCCLLCLRRRLRGFALLGFVSFVGATMVLGCSSRGSEKQQGTPIGSTMLQVTASSGTLTQSQALMITVQRP
jgi:hypothetical protein